MAYISQKPIYLKNNSNNTYIRRGAGDYKCDVEQIRTFMRDSIPNGQDSTTIDIFTYEDAINFPTLKNIDLYLEI